ncbi:MAG: tetratricopeptide repeat protein [Candidatus Latescibacteria bacterium]|nr:tetratricopeptide repeat protein [Candidatus Latescibacterota bacterium]
MTTRLVKHQKLTKRQIKEDPLVTAAFHGAAVWERHGSRILLGLGAVCLAGVLVFFVARTRARAEERATADVFRAEMLLQQQDLPTATQMLKEIVDNSPGTNAAKRAMQLLGDVYMAQGKPAEAVTWYRKYVARAGRDREAKLAGLHGLAAALEDRGDFIQAAANYGELVSLATTDGERGRTMLAQARCFGRAGQTQKAIEVYKAIQRLPDAEQDLLNAAGVGLGEMQATTPTR